MPPRRRTDPTLGRAALARVRAGGADRASLAAAVRWTTEELAAAVPGNSVEVRVPPFAVVQCVAGPRHTRGTPPNVVQTDAATWLALVAGDLTWRQALDDGVLDASGARSDLSGHLPLDLGTVGG